MPSPAVIIRVATVADAVAVASLLEELGYPWSADVMATRLRTFAEQGEIALLACADESRTGAASERANASHSESLAATPLGLVTLHCTPVLHRPSAVGRITALVVKSSARGIGVGKALVRAGETLLTERGCALIEVTSNRARTDAHQFYERIGYELTSFRFKNTLTPTV